MALVNILCVDAVQALELCQRWEIGDEPVYITVGEEIIINNFVEKLFKTSSKLLLALENFIKAFQQAWILYQILIGIRVNFCLKILEFLELIYPQSEGCDFDVFQISQRTGFIDRYILKIIRNASAFPLQGSNLLHPHLNSTIFNSHIFTKACLVVLSQLIKSILILSFLIPALHVFEVVFHTLNAVLVADICQ